MKADLLFSIIYKKTKQKAKRRRACCDVTWDFERYSFNFVVNEATKQEYFFVVNTTKSDMRATIYAAKVFSIAKLIIINIIFMDLRVYCYSLSFELYAGNENYIFFLHIFETK